MKSLLDKEYLKRLISRHEEQLVRYESVINPNETFNFPCGEVYGYLRGRISTLYDLLDELEEEK